MMRVLIYFYKLTFYLCGTKNPPIKHPYFVLKSYKSPAFLVLCSYFSYKLFWKMAGPYGLWAPTWRPQINRNVCYWVLLQKREFISRGYHKHLSHTFSDTWTVQIAKFPDISHFFKPAWQFSRPSGTLFFFIRMFSRARLNILIFPPILGFKYSCIILNNSLWHFRFRIY